MRNSIAIKLVLGLALFLALFFAAAGLSFFQAESVHTKTDAIVEVLEPKRTVAYEMEVNSIETESQVLGYLRDPEPALRTQIDESLAKFRTFNTKYRGMMGFDEIAQVSFVLDEISLDISNTSASLLNQADIHQELLASIEQDFDSFIGLTSFDLNQQLELYNSYSPNKLHQLQTIETKIAEINHSLSAYLRSPKDIYREEIAGYSGDFYDSLGYFTHGGVTEGESLAPVQTAFLDDGELTDEESQRAAQLAALFGDTQGQVTTALDSKDRLDRTLARFLDQRSRLNEILRLQVLAPAELEITDAKASVHAIDYQTERVTLALLLVGLVLVSGGSFLIYRRVFKPVNDLVNASNQVAEGDLSTRVDVSSNDEIGLLGVAFNEMIANREEAESALVRSEEAERKLAVENAVNATIGIIVNSSLDLEEVYDAFTEEVRTVVRFDWLAISILDRNMLYQRIDYVSGELVPNLRRGTQLGLEGTLVGTVAERRACVLETCGSPDSILGDSHSASFIAEAGIQFALGVPLFSRNIVIGALVFATADDRAYSASETTVARNVADQLAGAVANAQIHAERQETQAQLLRAHNELENRVMERTLELEKTRDIAEDATKAKSQFLANMSHELRTPLNAVIGYGELLTDQATAENNSGIIPDLQRITASGKHLLHLVNNILDLARIEAGKMELFIEEFSISNLVEEVNDISKTLITANSNTLSVDCPATIGVMQSDQVKVRQMLFNLLSNASKFTENGALSLRVSREVRDGAEWVIFTVADNGIGMTPDVVQKLFQPFTQADSSTVRKHGGSGLGLSLCRSFSRSMGGTITLDTTLGLGSTFEISLPAVITGPATEVIEEFTGNAPRDVPENVPESVTKEVSGTFAQDFTQPAGIAAENPF